MLGLTFGAMSVTPSLVPRAWFLQALVTGLCIATGYGLGAFVGWAYRALGLPNLPPGARRIAWQVLAVLAVVVLLVGGWLGRSFQSGQRELLGMDTSVPLLWLVGPLLGLLVAVLLHRHRPRDQVGRPRAVPPARPACCRRGWPG